MGLFDDIPQAGSLNQPLADQAEYEVTPGKDGAPTRIAPKRPTGLFDDLPNADVGVSEDVLRTVPAALSRGISAVAGIPAAVDEWVATPLAAAPGRAYNYIFGSGKYEDTPSMREGAEAREKNRVLPAPPSTEAIQSAVESVVPSLGYKPKTTTGQYAGTALEFIPSMAFGPGTLPQKVAMGAVSGLGSEGAGQAAQAIGADEAEPYFRLAGALAGGVGAGLAQRPSSAGNVLGQALHGVDDATMQAATALMDDAQRMGVALTWPEAINQASQGAATRLANLQRVVEGSEGGSSVMGPFMAQRPQQMETAARSQFGSVGPVSPQPSMIGPEVGQAAEGVVGDVTRAINRSTRPLYQAAETQRVGPQVHQALISDPLYAQTLAEVRNNPALNATIANLPDDSVGVIDLVQRRLREAAENARVPGQTSSSNLAAANLEEARTVPLTAADAASGSRPATGTNPAIAGAYETARAAQQQLRAQYLEPLMAGPIGKLAKNDITTKRAIEALFPTNPLPNSAAEVELAVRALGRRNPRAARELVRAHVESVFNESTQALQSGANQFGGAGFTAVIRGNPQQAANLDAAIEAIGGRAAAQGFDRFLDVLAATGQRQRAGSTTAFNQELQDTLRRGSGLAEAASLTAGAGMKIPARIRQAFERYQLGQNTEEIARMITDPRALMTLRHLARTAPGSSKATMLINRLGGIANGSISTSRGPD